MNKNGISGFPFASDESCEHLFQLIRSARQRMTFFGLTRNFYTSPAMSELLIDRSVAVPINILLLNPYSPYWPERYRMEPGHARFHDPENYRPILERFAEMMNAAAARGGELHVQYYEFQPGFGIEQIDDTLRVNFYGYHKAGTDSPILVLDSEQESMFRYFSDQLQSILENNQANSILRLLEPARDLP